MATDAPQDRQVPRDWDPAKPWSCVFAQLAADAEYWAERAHHPAAALTAAGGRGAPTVATAAAVHRGHARRPQSNGAQSNGVEPRWRRRQKDAVQ